MIRSLGFRLGLGAILFISLALFFTWLGLSSLFANYVLTKNQSELQAVIDAITTQIRLSPDGAPFTLAATPVDQRYLTPAGGHYWQIAEKDGGVLRSPSLFDSDLPVVTDGGTLQRAKGPDGEDVLALVNAISIDDRDFAIAAAVSATEIEAETASFRFELARMMVVTSLALLIAAFLQILAGLAPLRRLGTAIEGIRNGTLTHMPDNVPEELKPLTNQLNTLLDERNLALARAQARANDLAHGIKTPLTILAHIGETLNAATKIGDQGQQIQEQVDMVRQRVDRQLAIARISRNMGLSTELAPLTARLVAAIFPIAEKRGIAIHNTVSERFIVAAANVDIAETIGNILDNAVEWAKSSVTISAGRLTGSRNMIRVTIHDDGPGIEEAHYKEALGRGGRLDESRKQNGIGSGLGLAIAADILEAVGGTMTLSRSISGGLSVSMDWPQLI